MLQETKGSQLGIRAAKMKEAQMRAEGVPGGRAARAASGADKKKASKAKQKRARWAQQDPIPCDEHCAMLRACVVAANTGCTLLTTSHSSMKVP